MCLLCKKCENAGVHKRGKEKKMKKILAILLAAMMVLSFAACSKKDDATTASDESTTQAAQSGERTETETNEDGSVKETVYDAENRVIKETITEPDGTKTVTEYEYDAQGRVIKETKNEHDPSYDAKDPEEALHIDTKSVAVTTYDKNENGYERKTVERKTYLADGSEDDAGYALQVFCKDEPNGVTEKYSEKDDKGKLVDVVVRERATKADGRYVITSTGVRGFQTEWDFTVEGSIEYEVKEVVSYDKNDKVTSSKLYYGDKLVGENGKKVG